MFHSQIQSLFVGGFFFKINWMTVGGSQTGLTSQWRPPLEEPHRRSTQKGWDDVVCQWNCTRSLFQVHGLFKEDCRHQFQMKNSGLTIMQPHSVTWLNSTQTTPWLTLDSYPKSKLLLLRSASLSPIVLKVETRQPFIFTTLYFLFGVVP